MSIKWLLMASPLFLGACAVTSTPTQPVEAPVSRAQQIEAQRQVAAPQVKTLKRKIAIGRFTNETRYGKTFQVDSNLDPLGKQASDMLNSRLISSNKFLTFERSDLEKIKNEQALLKEGNLIGVDTLILGSVTEFGRSTTGKSGFLSATKIQTARAKLRYVWSMHVPASSSLPLPAQVRPPANQVKLPDSAARPTTTAP